ncbi:hypothetical protein KEM52_006029 [Ascosphaera acerosa]|nr:hypothetical protein KEM52_006029 [Ascosphaera acerosa]
MGNDGGSIPTRRELVKQSARNPTTTELKENLHELLTYRWTTCALSRKELEPPIVSDCAGFLYNKESIIQYLLPSDDDTVGGFASRAECAEVLGGRVKSLRDVVEVRFEREQAADLAASGGRAAHAIEGTTVPQFICPITRKLLGPTTRSVYLVPCGHAFSWEAVWEAKSDRCPICDEVYAPENVIPILSVKEAEKQQLAARVAALAEQGLTHSLKKAPGAGGRKRKKAEKRAEKGGKGEKGEKAQQEDLERSQVQPHPTKKHRKHDLTTRTDGIADAATAMLTSRVLKEQEELRKRRHMDRNDNIQSLYTSSAAKEGVKDADFLTRGYSFPSKTAR